MNRTFIYVLFTLALLSISCKKDSSPTSDDGGAKIVEDLPVQTINFVRDSTSGYWRFYTNDTAYCPSSGAKGYYHIFDTVYAPFDSVETVVAKYSGAYAYMYGVFFCWQTNYDTYRLLISVNGGYEVLKYISGVNYWYNFNTDSWSLTNQFTYPTSQYLLKGYGSLNRIKVVATGGGNYDLYFNGVKSDSFSDASLTGGTTGIVAYLGVKTEENFPNFPVDVRFKQLSAN